MVSCKRGTLYSEHTVQCANRAVCTLSRVHTVHVHTVQCAHCTVCTLYSVHTVQCANCTVCTLYSVPLLRETILFQEMCAPLARNHTCSRNVCPSCTKPRFFKKCVPLLRETTLFREMCAPLARNHTFSINVCPSCTKPYFSAKTPKATRVDM